MLIKPHAKTSNGVKSGDLGGQAVGLPLLINTWQELEYRYISVELQQVPTLKCTDVHKNRFELLCTVLKT